MHLISCTTVLITDTIISLCVLYDLLIVKVKNTF
jgi:hypothetical protein